MHMFVSKNPNLFASACPIFYGKTDTNHTIDFFKKILLGFTPWKAEQPLHGMELQEKKCKKDYRPLRS